MSELSLKVIDKSGKTRFVASGDNEVVLVNTSEYQEGDRISLETGEKNIYVWFQADILQKRLWEVHIICMLGWHARMNSNATETLHSIYMTSMVTRIASHMHMPMWRREVSRSLLQEMP